MKDRSAVWPPSPSKRWSHDFSHVILIYSSYVAHSALTLPKVTEALTNIDKACGASVPLLAKILATNPVAMRRLIGGEDFDEEEVERTARAETTVVLTCECFWMSHP